MISIILCARKPDRLATLKNNVEKTIGVAFEWVIIDNSTNKHSIFTAYNEGIAKSIHPYLCFIHEDVLFETPDWGKHLCAHLDRSETGLIGLCGSPYQSNVPSSWSLYNYTAHIIQSDKGKKRRIFEPSPGYDNNHEKDVVALDGVFLAARRNLFEKIRFDQETFKSFHAYDLDICLQSHQLGFRNKAINDILLIHFSRGRRNKEWVNNVLRLSHKWQHTLPIAVTEMDTNHIKTREETYMWRTFLKYMVRYNYSNATCKRVLLTYMHQNDAFVSKVNSFAFTRWLCWIRIKHKPMSLFQSRFTEPNETVS